MARFKRTLWGDLGSSELPDSASMLILATQLWLRSQGPDQQIGWQNLVSLIVPYSKDIKLGTNVPKLPADVWVVTDGTVIDMPGSEGKLLWTSKVVSRELDLQWQGQAQLSYLVHPNWQEWALFHALLSLRSPLPGLTRTTAPQTIGGIETADFLNL